MYKILGKEETVPLSADPIHYFPIQLHQKSDLTLKCKSTQLFLQLHNKRKMSRLNTCHIPIFPRSNGMLDREIILSSTDKCMWTGRVFCKRKICINNLSTTVDLIVNKQITSSNFNKLIWLVKYDVEKESVSMRLVTFSLVLITYFLASIRESNIGGIIADQSMKSMSSL